MVVVTPEFIGVCEHVDFIGRVELSPLIGVVVRQLLYSVDGIDVFNDVFDSEFA